ncbi:MAG: HAD family hydrolase [Nanoarchaeota archaeon]|nr:HAD family hydrolase [Nanoarchaeota archaeon]
MIRAIFLDFDGTISDAHSIAFKSMVRTLDEYGHKFDQNTLLKLMGNKMHVIIKGLGLNAGHLDALRKRFYKHFTKAAVDGGIKLCVSVKPLWDLKKKYPLIIVSNSETSFLRKSIKKLGLKGLFNKIYGAEKFEDKDDMLEKLFKKMKIKPSEAIYVGDRFSDIEYAREAGCWAVAIHNKCAWSNLKTIKKEKPDYIIKDFRELKRVLKEINSIDRLPSRY